MPVVSLMEWNRYLQDHPDAHLLQTGEWGELKSAFGWEAVRLVSGALGAQILFRRLPLGFTIGYIPKPVFSSQYSVISEQFWAELDALCQKHHTVFCKLEPDSWDSDFILHPSAFIPSKYNIQPPRTLMVDIHGSEEEILDRMKQKTRYNIRLAEKKGVIVHPWGDIVAFHKMLLLTGARDGFGVHSFEYYQRAYQLLHPKGMGEVLVAEYEGQALAALFVARNGKRAYYLYGASTDVQRNRMPTYLLQWEAMKWAKGCDCEEYDLWGVPDEDKAVLEADFEKRHEGLWGVYRFKRGFGGELKRAVQALDRVYHPLLYWAYLQFIGNRE